MSNLSLTRTARDEFVKKIQVSEVIPHFLRNEYSETEKAAFNIRKESRGTKLKTEVRDLERLLLIKKVSEDKFSKHSIDQ